MIFQVKIELQIIEPVVWRRLLVSSEFYLSEFHNIIQIAMGWTNSHLHQFIKENTFYTQKIEDDFFWEEMNNVDYINHKISDLLSNPGDTIEYEYDFGDSWLHTITLEKIQEETADVIVPFCISGERVTPPENCGGPFGYMDMLSLKTGTRNKEKDAYFDPKEINKRFTPPELSYKQLLTSAKKEDIIYIGYLLMIKIKTNSRKEQIAEYIEKALAANPLLLKNALSYNEISLLNSLYNNNDTDSLFENPGLEMLLLLRLVVIEGPFSGNIKYPDKIKKTIAPRLQEILDDSFFRQASRIEDLIIGLVTLYGVLPVSKVQELINKHVETNINFTDILKIINSSARLLNRISITSCNSTIELYYPMIGNASAISREIGRRKDIQYKEFPTEEILDAAGDFHYFDVNNAYANLRKLICKHNMRDPDLLFHHIWITLQTEESPMQILDILGKDIIFDNFEDIQKLLNALMDYVNSTPKWILKGNTSKEIYERFESKTSKEMFEKFKSDFKKTKDHKFHENPERTQNPKRTQSPERTQNPEQNPQVIPLFSPKIGRNDPCPCGSGKKYKHCCGNN